MSAGQKDWIAKWLPVIVAILTCGAFYGRTEQAFDGFRAENLSMRTYFEAKISALKDEVSALRTDMMPMEKRVEMFVTRREFTDLKVMAHDTNQKVDAIYQRQFGQLAPPKKNPND